MLLTSLVEYSHRRNANLAPPGCERKTVKWIIPLDRSGNLSGEFEPTAGSSHNLRGGKQFIVPRRPSKPPCTARALLDKASYVLGTPDAKRGEEHALRCHLSFLSEAEICARETGLSSVLAICRFLHQWNPATGSLPASLAPYDLITFRVGTVYPALLPDIQKYWSQRLIGGLEIAGAEAGVCVVCKKTCRRARVFPQKLSRLRNAHASGINLLSIHGAAFESYGQKGALGIPICTQCGEAATRAANTPPLGEFRTSSGRQSQRISISGHSLQSHGLKRSEHCSRAASHKETSP
jgi:hypothetical protein